MSLDDPDGLTLVCKHCRWHPPGDLQMTLVESHFDLEPDHDPRDIRLELVAWCERCQREMVLDMSTPIRGGQRHHYTCGGCRRSRTVNQKDPS